MTEIYKPRKGKQKKKKTNWGFFYFLNCSLTQEGRNNQCKDRTLRSNEAFYETQWTLERACKWPAGLINFPKHKNVSGLQNRTDSEEAN